MWKRLQQRWQEHSERVGAGAGDQEQDDEKTGDDEPSPTFLLSHGYPQTSEARGDTSDEREQQPRQRAGVVHQIHCPASLLGIRPCPFSGQTDSFTLSTTNSPHRIPAFTPLGSEV